MTTAVEVINMALKDAGIIAEGETASADIAADAFSCLTQMLDMWQVDNLYVYGMVENSFSPTGAVSYTVGALGTIAITRPESIEAAFWRLNGIDYPLTMINTFEEYETLQQKTQSGEPRLLFYRPSYTLGTLYIYPQPSTGTVHLISKIRLPALASSADTITLPPEYIMPIRFSLAEILSATFNVPINDGLVSMARRSRTMLKRNNVRVPELGMPANLPIRHYSDIFVG